MTAFADEVIVSPNDANCSLAPGPGMLAVGNQYVGDGYEASRVLEATGYAPLTILYAYTYYYGYGAFVSKGVNNASGGVLVAAPLAYYGDATMTLHSTARSTLAIGEVFANSADQTIDVRGRASIVAALALNANIDWGLGQSIAALRAKDDAFIRGTAAGLQEGAGIHALVAKDDSYVKIAEGPSMGALSISGANAEVLQNAAGQFVFGVLDDAGTGGRVEIEQYGNSETVGAFADMRANSAGSTVRIEQAQQAAQFVVARMRAGNDTIRRIVTWGRGTFGAFNLAEPQEGDATEQDALFGFGSATPNNGAKGVIAAVCAAPAGSNQSIMNCNGNGCLAGTFLREGYVVVGDESGGSIIAAAAGDAGGTRSTMILQGLGSTLIGSTRNGHDMRVEGNGCFAFGCADTEDIVAGVPVPDLGGSLGGVTSPDTVFDMVRNVGQIFPGTNVEPRTVGIGPRGTGLRLCADGKPSDVTNGDIWTANGAIYGHSEGSDVKFGGGGGGPSISDGGAGQ